eukprot:CAMPEP_0117598552 /NCGR_PEP_ID=MMETSP0784-20121206/75464_1 /TAXON_ID=39447 /ORGANISM="" /LENGTH=44 /DNA_ID= /DNA_START= /DNA_END= /DNA_ORIENTATION=
MPQSTGGADERAMDVEKSQARSGALADRRIAAQCQTCCGRCVTN